MKETLSREKEKRQDFQMRNIIENERERQRRRMCLKRSYQEKEERKNGKVRGRENLNVRKEREDIAAQGELEIKDIGTERKL